MIKIIQRLVEICSKSGKGECVFKFLIFLIGVFPMLLMSYLDYSGAKTRLTELVFARRESLAKAASILLKEKFDHIVNLGNYFARSAQFQNLILEGKPDEAVKLLERAPRDFAHIDTIGIFDPRGALVAVLPHMPEAIGKDFSYRDYYKGVSKNWRPYVSEVFKRAVEPKYNIVSVAVPIKTESPSETESKILGVLVLTVKLDSILDWMREVDVGSGEFAYFVDQKGHVAGHPRFSPSADVVDFSEVPVVKKVLRGEKGAEIGYDQIEKEEIILAYEPVSAYGWGAVIEQSTYLAFASTQSRLRQLLILDGVMLLVVILFLYVILRFIIILNAYRQKEKVFLESVGDGLVAIDRHWNITLWNKAAAFLTGYAKEEAMHKPFREIVKFMREKDRGENIQFIEDAMLLGKVQSMDVDTVLLQKNGKEISIGDSASPIFDEKGVVSGVIIIFRDISRERELEKAREEFASLASHQLRTPVTVIRGYAELLAEESAFAGKQRKEALVAIQKAANSLNELVNAMLNVSRIDAGTIAITPEPAYLPDIAKKIIKEMSPQIDKNKLIMEEKYDSAIPAVNVDIKLTEAIMRNLLSNAIKYTPPKGAVTVKVELKKQDVILTVSDTGIGIPKDQQTKVFNKFFRAGNATEKTEGTGLGLYIVKSIISQAGGKIWFESEENKGTTFYVAIPLSGMIKKEGMKGLS